MYEIRGLVNGEDDKVRVVHDSDVEDAVRLMRNRIRGMGMYAITARNLDHHASAYRGPRGWQIEPYWWGKNGAPRRMADGKQVTIYLDEASCAEAKRLGSGNLSAGVRLAIQRFAESSRDRGC